MAEGPQWEGNLDARWVEIQKKTFTRWANTYLKERMMKLDDLATGFHDGVLLINLLEIISSKEVGKYNKTPKIRTQKLENTLFALNFLKSEGIKLVNIGNDDIVDGNVKLILGLIWTVICRYQIHIEEGKSARSDLLKWVRSKIPEYNIMNFSSDWNDGRAICALGDALKSGFCPHHKELDPRNSLSNARLGCDQGEKLMGIPQILGPEDMIHPDVDELSVMTYVSYYRDWEAKEAKKKSVEELEKIAVPNRCRAYGPGLERGETYVPTEFTIEAINQFGRRVPHGGDPFDVQIKSPKGIVPFTFADNQDGTYRVNYTPTDLGKHIVTITLQNQNISGSPFTVPVVRGGPDATRCRAYGPGIEPGNKVAEQTHFTVECFNKLGEKVKEGGDKVEVRIKGPYDTEVLPEIVDNRDGTYRSAYKPVDSGDHVVSVFVNNEPIPQNPINVFIAKSTTEPDAMYCLAYGPGLEAGYTSEPSIFTVEVRNSKNERLHRGGWPIDVDVSDANGLEVGAKIHDNNDGTFTVTFQPVDPGHHTIDVILRHKVLPFYYEHIKDSPFRVLVGAGTDASKSSAFGPGLEDKVTDQLPTNFTIQSKDRNGNNMNKGGDPWDVKIQGPDGPVDANVKDNDDGTYTVTYAPTTPGKHRVDVTLKGAPVAKSPFTVIVKEGADEAFSIIESYSFVIQAKTKKNTNRKDGGDDFKVTITGPNGPVHDVKLVDNTNGTYTVTYRLPSPGSYTINVTLNGKPLKGWSNGIRVSY